MEFRFVTSYDQKALTAMARALRKTVRRKRSRRTRVLGVIAAAMGMLLALNSDPGSLRTKVTWAAVIVMLAALIWEDALNGYFAKKRLLKGTERSESVFTEDGFATVTEIGRTEWNYDKIAAIAETKDYFVLIFSQSHAQCHDKSSISGGRAEDFREFIAKMTGREMQPVK